ncbi:MAG: hypothetical protein IJ529_02565 [Alphaproteobacteria bacterium]|nr:hypothetical protein [Alphaproteobacteria bacterium]
MKKILNILAVTAVLVFSTAAAAQLPSNPFNTKENDGVFKSVKDTADTQESVTQAPMYSDGVTGGEVLPVDPWANARDRSGVETWRGSAQHGRLNYVGEATTFTDAQGQEMIAPEVNRHNMVVGLDHLRKLGYKIPEEYNDKVKNMPAAYRALLEKNLNEVQRNDDPLSEGFTNMMDLFERGTGLDLNNLLFNSLKLLGTD